MFIIKRLLLVTLLILAPQLTLAATWKIDPAHTTVEFKVRHLMVAWVKGVFTQVEGTAEIDDADLARASVSVRIETASINTNNDKRDEHLRSADFFEVARYPVMTFVSREVVVANGVPVKIVGDLTLRDVTREVVLEIADYSQTVIDPWGNTRRGATATTKVDRKDFGLTWNKALEAGGVVVGDEVQVTLEVELIKN